MWSARQTWKMGRRAAGFLGGLLATILLVAAPAAAAFVDVNLINVSKSPLVSSELPAIAVNKAGRVFVAWKEGPDPLNGTWKILYKRSLQTQASCGGGLKFDENEMPATLWAGTVAPSRPALAANDNGEVSVAWQASSAVWFNRSANDGQAFFDLVPPSPLNLGVSISSFDVPSVAEDNAGGVFVAWSKGFFPAEIYFARSMPGAGFELPALPVSGTATHSRAPSLATDGSNIFLAWEEWGPGPLGFFKSSILHKKFGQTDALAGVAGMPFTNLSSVLFPTGVGRAFGPNVAFGNGSLSVVFGASNGPSFYHRWSGDGDTFSGPVNVSDAMSSLSPSDARVARGNDGALVAWAQKLGLTDADTEIQYWLAGPTTERGPVSSTLGASSVNPAAATDPTGRLLVAWQETVNGSDEIYLNYSGGTGTKPTEATVWARGHGPGDADDDDDQEYGEERSERGRGAHGRVTLYVELSDSSAGAIVLGTLKLNGESATAAKSAVGDKNHNGIPDMKLKFNLKWNDLQSITVTGSTTTGVCFSGTAFRNKH